MYYTLQGPPINPMTAGAYDGLYSILREPERPPQASDTVSLLNPCKKLQ